MGLCNLSLLCIYICKYIHIVKVLLLGGGGGYFHSTLWTWVDALLPVCMRGGGGGVLSPPVRTTPRGVCCGMRGVRYQKQVL